MTFLAMCLRYARSLRIPLMAAGSAALLATSASAEVKLPHMLSDHAVLQRDMPIHIWGTADPDEKVSVDFHGQTQQATTDQLGHWSLYLQPEHAGGPYTLMVKGTNTLTLSDILVGDVWFASGQSNMEFPLKGFGPTTPLKNGAQEISAATLPQVHLLRFHNVASTYEQHDIDAEWTVCTPATATDFSAVAYFFGRALQQKEQAPMGLIDASWGGTPVSAWLSLDGLSSDASLMPEFAARVPMVEEQADVQAMTAAESARMRRHSQRASLRLNTPGIRCRLHTSQRPFSTVWLHQRSITPSRAFSGTRGRQIVQPAVHRFMNVPSQR